MANAKIIHRDLIPDAVITSDSFQPLLAPSQLQNPDLGLVWRTLQDVNSCYLLADFGETVSIGGTALLAYGGTDIAFFRVKVSTADATGATGDAYDSGSLGDSFDPVYRHFIHYWPSVSGRYLRIDILDNGGDYIEAGGWMAGPVWQPAHNFEHGFSFGWMDQDEIARSRGGVAWVSETGTWRFFRGRFPFITEEEKADELWSIGTRVKRRLPIIFTMNPDSDNLGRDTIVGRLQRVPEFVNVRNRDEYYIWDIDIQELV